MLRRYKRSRDLISSVMKLRSNLYIKTLDLEMNPGISPDLKRKTMI
jgi:hypothetical protein